MTTDQGELIRRSEALGLDPKTLRELIDAVNRNQAWYGLVTAVTLRDNIERTIEHLVTQSRSAGITWVRIGDLLGMSRQGAQQRYGVNDG